MAQTPKPPEGTARRVSAPTLPWLRSHRPEVETVLAAYGASNPRVFGSVVRGESDAASDVDLLVDIEAEVHGFAYFGLLEDIRRELEARVGAAFDIVDAAALSRMRERVLAEAVPL